VPIGLTVPFHRDGLSGELYLMSFAHTGSGARFIAVWGIRTPLLQLRLGLAHPDLIPFEQFTVADCYMGVVLGWSGHVKLDLGKWPELKRYVDRVQARPHVVEALKSEGLIK